jgi:hypothetical protein
MSSTIKILNKKARKESRMTFYKATAVPVLTYASEIRITTKQNREQKLKLQK